MRTAVFPAYARLQAEPAEGVPVLLTGESPCFFHPTRRAAVACDRCGRLVCSLCDLEVGADHWCPECLPLLDQEGRAGLLERERTRYDRVIGSMLLLALVLGGLPAPVTTPAVLGLVLAKWRAPGSRVDRTRLRMVLAVPVALGELVWGGWMWLQVVA